MGCTVKSIGKSFLLFVCSRYGWTLRTGQRMCSNFLTPLSPSLAFIIPAHITSLHLFFVPRKVTEGKGIGEKRFCPALLLTPCFAGLVFLVPFPLLYFDSFLCLSTFYSFLLLSFLLLLFSSVSIPLFQTLLSLDHATTRTARAATASPAQDY